MSYGDISGDEPFTIFYAQADASTFYDMLKTENNPPLFFLMEHYWVKLFGISSLSTRFLPLLFSSLTVVFIYLIGKSFFNLKVAIIASILFTFSNYHIYFAHETRVYALFTLLTCMSMYSFMGAIKSKNKRSYIIGLIICNALLIYSHFFGFFVLLIQGLSVISIKNYRLSFFKHYVIASLLTLVLYIPYLSLLATRFSAASGGTWVKPPVLEDLYKILWAFSNMPVNTIVFLSLLLLAVVLYFLNKASTKINIHAPLILLWFLFPFLGMFLLSYWIPMFIERYVVFISIGYYFSISIAINYLSRNKWIEYGLIGLISILMIATCDLKSGRDQQQSKIVDTVISNSTSETAIYICPQWLKYGFLYHYNTNYFKDYKHSWELLKKDNIYPMDSKFELNNSTSFNKAIYITSHPELVDPNNDIYKDLESNYTLTSTNTKYNGYVIYFFSR